MTIKHYSLCGWKVSSSINLPWLQPRVDLGENPDVIIETGFFPNPDEFPLVHTVMVNVYPKCAVVDIPGLLRFLVEDGRRVVVEAYPGADPAEFQPFLLGTGLALLCYQRGLIPLHGCAVSKKGVAIAVLGHSASGKSTLAAALLNRSYRLITDGILVFDPVSGLVLPTYPVLKLWKDSAVRLGVSTQDLPRVRKGLEKFSLQLPEVYQAEPVTIKAIVLLKSSRTALSPSLSRLKAADAMLRLHAFLYGERLDRMPGSVARNFTAFMLLAKQAFFFDIIRTTDSIDFKLSELMDYIDAASES